jgi:tRNA G18 (ribose-2'-O)-methylase SpoU
MGDAVDPASAVYLEMVTALVPCLTCHQGHQRVLSQLYFVKAAAKLAKAGVLTAEAGDSSYGGRFTWELYQHFEESKFYKKLRRDQMEYLKSYDLVHRLTMDGMLHNTMGESDHFLPDHMFTKLKKIQQSVLYQARMEREALDAQLEAVNAPAVTVAALEGEQKKQAGVVSADMVFANFQKKIRVGGLHIDTVQDNVAVMNQNGRRVAVEEDYHEKDRQELIMVASLISKPANLGGLSRTCEIFNVQQLVVGDLKIKKNNTFKSVSVTAGQWMPMREVKGDVASIAAFLHEKQQAGFTVVAAEQTANSVSLEKFSFPKKTVILMGREREGTPIELLNFVDHCVEIPQFGIVRSLNVHVCASLLVWEYTRQQLVAEQSS